MRRVKKERFRCEILSWESVARDAKKLARIIQRSGYCPEIIVAIARGGLVPARILSDYLHLKELAAIKVEHWGITATPGKEAVIKYPLNTDIKGKKVLLVDDITDTGDTLRVSVPYLMTFNPKEMRTATLLHKATSEIVPDYFVRKIGKWRWIIFPWHVWEDLTHFLRQMRQQNVRSVAAIREELKGRYSLDVSKAVISEILKELDAQ
jgi:hypoxanthine phosphoribosyltransferase